TVIRCDIDPDQLHKNLRGQVLVLGDASAFVDGLLARLGTGDDDGGVPAGDVSRDDSGTRDGDRSREDGTARAAQLRR
ncbi:hypothetical protein, partial [Mesomycoplasma flocculare]|uniref:hypothetical protein n=1 Tax=Mesomycoplasma flocculare TaxID=2128 RepID=UPI001C693994